MWALGCRRLRQIPQPLGDAGIPFESRVRWTQVIANPWLIQIAAIGIEDRISLLDQIVCGPCGKGLYRETGICRTLRREDAAITDK